MAENEKSGEQLERVWEWSTPYGPVRLGIDTVRKYFCPRATDVEIVHFIAVSRFHGLNPYLKECYLIKYSDNEAAKIVIGKDTHARQAEEHPEYKGDRSGIILINSEGKLEEREGNFFLDDETLLGGWAKVWRKDREDPIVVKVRMKEYVQTKGDGTPNRFWKGSPGTMIEKVALSQARHKAFPKRFAGMMSEEEAHSGPRAEEPITITMPQSNAEAAAEETESPARPAEGKETPADPGVEGAAATPAGDVPLPTDDNGLLAAEARAREAFEAAQEQAPPAPAPATVRIDRGKIWNALLRKAKTEAKGAVPLLKELTGRSGMTELDDSQVFELAKKLRV